MKKLLISLSLIAYILFSNMRAMEIPRDSVQASEHVC